MYCTVQFNSYFFSLFSVPELDYTYPRLKYWYLQALSLSWKTETCRVRIWNIKVWKIIYAKSFQEKVCIINTFTHLTIYMLNVYHIRSHLFLKNNIWNNIQCWISWIKHHVHNVSISSRAHKIDPFPSFMHSDVNRM